MKKISLMLVTIVLFLFLVASCHGRLVPKDDIQTVKDFEVPETFDESKDIQKIGRASCRERVFLYV